MPASSTSPFLSERLISRLSPLRRSNLWRRIQEHANDAAQGRDARGNVTHDGPTPHATRTLCVLGRLASLSFTEIR